MDQHVRILGVLYIAFNLIALAVAALIFLILTGAGVLSGDAEALFITSTVGMVIGLFLGMLSLPGIVAGIGLLKRREWGRILALILGVLNLLNIPFGTLLGLYSLWVLANQETINLFRRARMATP
ncbi:MAG: hypothetical protein H6695_01070 [Deferribacteres bacterium]|nr:hypothetical protein [candidate division KSB1 bacterium]MCB9508740.1 hypothetical protein [Deferribacteres bacterium]